MNDKETRDVEIVKKLVDTALDICVRGNVPGEICKALQNTINAIYDAMYK